MAWLVLVAFLVGGPALALEIPSRPAGRVTDLAALLTTDQRQALEKRLADFEREATHQVAILLIPSLEGEPLEPFSHKIATTWKLGQAGVDNGVLILIAQRDRKIRIEVGYGLEASLPDGLAGDIIRETIAPKFRQGQYYQGLNDALDRIFGATRETIPAVRPAVPHGSWLRTWGETLALCLLAVLGLFGLYHFPAGRFLGTPFRAVFGSSGAILLAGIAGLRAAPWQYLAYWLGLGAFLEFVNFGVESRHRCPSCRGWVDVQESVTPTGKVDGSFEELLVVERFKCVRCDFSRQERRVVRESLATPSDGGADYSGWSADISGWSSGGSGQWSSDSASSNDSGSSSDRGFSGGGGGFGGGGASGSW